MPPVRGTTNVVSGESHLRKYHKLMRLQCSPQHFQRLLNPRTPTSRADQASADQTVAQPKWRVLTLLEAHAKSIKRRIQQRRMEEQRLIASSLPPATANPPRQNTTIPSNMPQHSTDNVIEETPTEPDEETRTEVATEIDDAASEREALGDDQFEGGSDAQKNTGESTVERDGKSENEEQNLQEQAESFLQSIIGPNVEPPIPRRVDEEAKTQENDLHLTSSIELQPAAEFVQGSSRDGQVGSGNQTQSQADKVRNWLDSQAIPQTYQTLNPPVYYNPHPTPRPSVSYIPIPMDTSPNLSDYHMMDTSPDPESTKDIGVFTASGFLPPQPMRGVQRTVTQVAMPVTSAPFETSSRSFGPCRALSNPFAAASTLHPQWYLKTTDIPTSSNPLLTAAVSLTRPSEDESTLSLPSDVFPRWATGANWSHSNPFLNASRSRSQFQTEQPRSSSGFDNYLSSNPFSVAPYSRESYHESISSEHRIAFDQTFPQQQPLLSEGLSMANQGVEETQGAKYSTEQEREAEVEPFIIETCEEQEAWWDGISEWSWAKKSQSHWDFSPQNGVPVLDVTRPVHIRATWKNLSMRNASSFVDNTDDVVKSLEGFDELLERRVDTELLRRSYLGHSKMEAQVSEDKLTCLRLGKLKAPSPRRPAKLKRSPYSFPKRFRSRNSSSLIRSVLGDFAAAFPRFPFGHF